MKRHVINVFTIFIVCFLPALAVAYSETPFVNAKKGETKTHRGWIVSTGDDGQPFLVVVTLGCKSGHTAFFATAARHVVSNDQLGKPVMITAKVIDKLERQSNHPLINLRILRVQPFSKKKNPAP